MIRRIATGALLAAFLVHAPLALAVGRSGPAPAPSSAKASRAHTVTWWCVDVNDLLKVDVPVLVIRPWLLGGPPCATTTSWPQAIPAGSQWTEFSSWISNKTYPKQVAAALQAMPGGYHFASNSPMEDFLTKLTEVRYDVVDFATGDLVAQYRFDPQKVFRRLQWGDLLGSQPISPIVDPSLGLDLDEAAVRRLPMMAFGGIAPSLPPGTYIAFTHWVLAERHCDGLGTDPDNNCLPAGDTRIVGSLFDVVP